MKKNSDTPLDPSRRRLLRGLAAAPALAALPAGAQAPALLEVEIDPAVDRTWIGSRFWANRLQDWRARNGRIECLAADRTLPYRTLHLLAHRLTSQGGAWEMRVETGPMSEGALPRAAAAGFLIGAGGEEMDYRAAALIHGAAGPQGGIVAALDGEGRPFIRRFTEAQPRPRGLGQPLPRRIELTLTCRPGGDRCSLELTARDPVAGREIGTARLDVERAELAGSVALLSHGGHEEGAGGFWFRNWALHGAGWQVDESRAWGPILAMLWTRHEGRLRLTAQLPPLGQGDSHTAELQTRRNGRWTAVATAPIETPSWTALFDIPSWPAGEDAPYRVAFRCRDGGGVREFSREGVIRKDPVDKDEVVVASLNCLQQMLGQVRDGLYRWDQNVYFPHNEVVAAVRHHKPDLYFFAGDQIYEGVPTPTQRQPAAAAELDYLYKYYLWCWTYHDLVRDTPSVVIPDDHDVYQGNIWGMAGAPARPGDPGGQHGGYGMPPRWVNMVQRTQTAHLPAPYDPTPVQQGITVYYTALNVGGVGFAIIEDRKFKSSPDIVPAEKTPDSHIIEPGYDTRRADVPGAELLGERQIRFLEEFAADWEGQEMKAVLSQTIFCNLQISSRGVTAGQLDKDLDSGGWPQSGRAKALAAMRKGAMIHLAGDQHLASVVHHGIDDWEDAVWSFCAPATANFYPRFWNPDYPPRDPVPGRSPFLGRYEDGFHNKLTIHAVANPVTAPAEGEFPEPVELHRKAPGYGIIRFNKRTREVRLECWPRYAFPGNPAGGRQYKGWPITLHQSRLDGRKASGKLPAITVEGVSRPVVRVRRAGSDELLYARRAEGPGWEAPIWGEGAYRVEVGDPETNRWQTLERVEANADGQAKPIRIRLKKD